VWWALESVRARGRAQNSAHLPVFWLLLWSPNRNQSLDKMGPDCRVSVSWEFVNVDGFPSLRPSSTIDGSHGSWNFTDQDTAGNSQRTAAMHHVSENSDPFWPTYSMNEEETNLFCWNFNRNIFLSVWRISLIHAAFNAAVLSSTKLHHATTTDVF
jgi:hypothetical protein